jgi:hypothetical protein
VSLARKDRGYVGVFNWCEFRQGLLAVTTAGVEKKNVVHLFVGLPVQDGRSRCQRELSLRMNEFRWSEL